MSAPGTPDRGWLEWGTLANIIRDYEQARHGIMRCPKCHGVDDHFDDCLIAKFLMLETVPRPPQITLMAAYDSEPCKACEIDPSHRTVLAIRPCHLHEATIDRERKALYA